MTDFWINGSIGGVLTLSVDSVEKQHGNNSLKMTFIDDDTHSMTIYHDYAGDQDFTGYAYISFWWYGANTGQNMYIDFINEVYDDYSDGYTRTFIDNFTGWQYFHILRSAFSTFGTPTGWNHIRSVVIGNTDVETSAVWRLDYLTVDDGENYTIIWDDFPLSTKTNSIDVIFEKLGVTKTDSIDVLFKKLGLTKPHFIDVLITSRVSSTDDIDVLFKKLGITKTDSIDVLFKKLGVTTSSSIDMRLWSDAHPYYEYEIDVLLQKLGLTKTDEVDILFKKLGLTVTNPIDVLLKKLGVTKTDSIDVMFKKLGVTTTTTIDVILQTIIPPTPVPDVPETLQITNGIYTLWARPISWKENQSCKPAIRPIPLAESEYLDSDTWVLKPRTIECKIRLSDREKDLFESIYNYPSTLPSRLTTAINNYLDFYLIYDNSKYIWHYLVWITDKSYKFIYEYQHNRYVRWWIVTLTCDVQEFSGSSSTLPTWEISDYRGYTTYLEDSNWKIYNSAYLDNIAKAVKIGNERLNHVLDFSRDDSHPPMIPKWINQLAEVDSYIWNECVLDTSYTCRMTNAEKYHMDLLLQSHSKLAYEDYIHNLFSKAGIGGGEQIVNGGFENIMWMTGWDYKANFSVTSTNPHSGTYCCANDAYDMIDIGQTLANPVPVDAIKSFKMWIRTTSTVPLAEIDFVTTDDTFLTLPIIGNTSGIWTEIDLKALMIANDVTGNLLYVSFFLPSAGIAIDDVSLNAESIGAWVTSVEAQWDPNNWIKPWKVSIALKANNSEIESRTATVSISSSYNDGDMYLDEITVGNNPNAEHSSLPWSYSGDYGNSNSCTVGVHIFYFFQPAGSIWDGWVITGDILKMDTRGDTPNGIGGEHILTVLIYGDCTIQAVFHYPTPIATCVVIALDSAMTANANEAMRNGGFEDAPSYVPWTIGTMGELDDTRAYSGDWSCKLSENGGISGIRQDFLYPALGTTIDSWGLYWYPTEEWSVLYVYAYFMDGEIESHILLNFDAATLNDWNFADIRAALVATGPSWESIEYIGIGILNPEYEDFWIDDVSLVYSPILTDINAGIISIDGIPQGECEDGGLPADFVGAIVVGLDLGGYPTYYDLIWVTDLAHPDFTFDHWEVICGDIAITNVNSASTTFKMNSGTIAWIRAIYEDLVDYSVDLDYSGYDSPCNPPIMIINGVEYILPDTLYEFFGDWTTSVSVGSGDNAHLFDHWESTGGVTVDDIYDASTIMHITANGTLTAVFHNVVWEFITNHLLDPNQGQYNIYFTPYWVNLPDGPYDAYFFSSPIPLQWRANGNGGTFSHWSFTGGIHIADVNNANTTFWVSDSFTVTANYT